MWRAKRTAQALKLKEHATRVKISERLALAHERELSARRRRKELMEVVEQFVGRKPTSLP